ncbi:hypothetical protein PSTG_16215 [Puccinia striiformis f. sp. tritici PST-78]|uniref:Uncharacterized protein n=1 Tax=Puccinia striiformis f. sp. tritici PST-78 TaxID=1165861 RepID=A0A0L0UUB0_9BASI|nr:hypothetical protein PSTG_16215 [Puccinia striiformis f. sp. tritici PST-78]
MAFTTKRLPRSSSETGRAIQQHQKPKTHNRTSTTISSGSAASWNNNSRTSPASQNSSATNSSNNNNNNQTQFVKQLIIRATPNHPRAQPPAANELLPSDGLKVMMWIRLAIPYSLIPLPGSPDLILPLMSDQRLRLTDHTIFPITRRSANSKPTIRASANHSSQAKLAASLLDLSNSFTTKTKDHLPQPPSITVVVRNFTISLLIPASLRHSFSLDHSSSPFPASTMAEYAIVLDCLSLWATVGPEWPFSVILPTPPCLKNTFRLILPTESSNALFEEDTQKTSTRPAVVHLNTFPPLRRERMRFSSSSRNVFSPARLSLISQNDDLRPLSDESEPEGISLSDEEDTQNQLPQKHWSQDVLSPRFEGVFQSTKELCILLGAHPPATSFDTPLKAKHASSQLSVSVHHTPSTTHTIDPHPTSMDISFHVDLQHVTTHSISDKTAFILAIPQHVAKNITLAQWSPLNGEGVLETLLPLPVQSSQKDTIAPASPATSSPFHGASSLLKGIRHSLPPRSKTDAAVPELDLLNTAAPFLDSNSDDMQAEIVRDDSDLDLNFDHSSSDELPFRSSKPNGTLPRNSESRNSESTTDYQFVAWLDTEWLIRRAATNPNSVNSRLVLNLRGQLEISAIAGEPGSKRFPIPFLILPSVDEHTCECQISTDFPSRQDLQFTLPSWASFISEFADEQSHQLRLSVPNNHSNLTNIIIVNLDQPRSPQIPAAEPITSDSVADQVPSSPDPRPTEPSLSINQLIINSASRLKYHSCRSNVSPMSYVKKRPRLYGSLRSKSNKTRSGIENETRPSLFDEHTQTKPAIRSVEVDLMINRSSDKQPVISQYAEVCITLCRSSEIVDPHITIQFPVGSASVDTLDIVGVWIDDWELGRDQGFKVLEEEREEDASVISSRFVTIEIDLRRVEISRKNETSSSLPILRMIVSRKDENPVVDSEVDDDSFICLLPCVETSAAVYKAHLQASTGSQLQVKQSNMIVAQRSPEKIKLISYALRAGTPPLWTSMSFVKKSLPLLITEPEPTSDIPNTHEPKGETTECVEESEKSGSHVEALARSTSWVEECVIKWGLNWKTALLCWLIYLVTTMCIRVDRIDGRLERMDIQRSTGGGVPNEIPRSHTGPDEILSGSGGQLLYPIEEQALPSSDKPSEAEFIDTRLKAALLKSFLNTHDCTRRDPISTTEPPNRSDPILDQDPLTKSHEEYQEARLESDTHSTELIKDFLGFFNRLFFLSVSQPIAKLAGSFGSFRNKLSFRRRPRHHPQHQTRRSEF